MGKSKRIRADRARDAITSPEKYANISAERKAKRTTAILICVIAAIIIGSVALVALNKTGTIARMTVLYETENFEIDGAMATYMYNDTYNLYYSYYGSYMQYIGINIGSEVTSSAKTILARCEAAKAAGYTLTDADYAEIDEAIANLKAEAKAAGYSLSDMYGQGITKKDIKKVMELQKLASKIYEDKEEDFTDKILADQDRIDKFYAENPDLFLIGGYVSASVAKAEYFEKLKEAKTADEFKQIFIEYYVNENLLTTYNSETDKDVETLDKSLYEAVSAAIGYYVYGIKIEGVELDEVEDYEEDLTYDNFVKVYDKFRAEGDLNKKDVLEVVTKAAVELAVKVEKAITVKASYAHPKADANKNNTSTTTTAGTDASTDPTETTAGAAAAAETGVAGTDASTDTGSSGSTSTTTKPDTDAFNKWFFDQTRKENDVYADADGKTVYIVTKPALKDTDVTKDAGHILIKVDEDTDAAFAEAEAKAKEILNKYLAGEKTKEAFEKLAEENTDDGGVFYENITKGQMVEEFENWIFDRSRMEGDTGLVKTEFGWHVMYFVGDGLEGWVATALTELLADDVADWDKEIATTYVVTVNAKGVTKFFG